MRIDEIENAILLFHIDTDGICSAKIIGEALNRLNKRIIEFIPATPKLLNDRKFADSIKSIDCDTIIITDIELDKDSLIFKEAKRKFLVIDHHRIDNIPKGENVLYINPKLEGDSDFTCASAVSFDTFRKLVSIEDLDWVCAVGIIGDSAVKKHKSFLKRTMKKYDVKVGKDKEYFFDSFFGTLANMLNSGKIIKGNDGASISLKALQGSSTPDELYEKAYQLKQWASMVDSYLEEMKDRFEKRKEEYDNLELIFFTFVPKYTIGSVLSSILSFDNPHKTIIIISKKSGSIATINFRRQDGKYDMGLLAKLSTKGLKSAGGGGHIPAAGGHILAKDINLFKRNVVLELKKMMKDKSS